MAIFTGTPGDDDLFGTGKNDVLRGMGGEDRIQGNGGGDRISGSGDIYGNDGGDSYFAISFGDDLFSDGGERDFNIGRFDLGRGKDLAVFNFSIFHDLWSPRSPYGESLGDLRFGPGHDTAIFAGEVTGTSHMEKGRDKVWVSATAHLEPVIDLGYGDYSDDGAKDVVHIDSGCDVSIAHFGPDDLLVIHGLDISVGEVLKRVTFLSSTENRLEISLPNGTVIDVSKGGWTGDLTKDHIRIVEKPWAVKSEVMIEDEATLTPVKFLSAGDDVVKSPKMAIFANVGDDKMVGSHRADRFWGEAGDDRLIGRGGDDELNGGRGVDRLVGGRGADKLTGGADDDILRGGAQSDHLAIDLGADIARGGGGSDVFEIADIAFVSGARLFGGPGSDSFTFYEPEKTSYFGESKVVIEDFRPGRDTINVRSAFAPEVTRSERKEAIIEGLSDAYETSADDNDYHVDGLRLFIDGGPSLYLSDLGLGDVSISDFIF